MNLASVDRICEIEYIYIYISIYLYPLQVLCIHSFRPFSILFCSWLAEVPSPLGSWHADSCLGFRALMHCFIYLACIWLYRASGAGYLGVGEACCAGS